MFDTELLTLYGSFFNTNSRPDLIQQNQGDVVEKPTIEKQPSSSNFEDEVAILEKKYGKLKDNTIQVSLSDMLDMIPRHRRRIDAYNGLTKWLKETHNVCLQLTSRKTE